MNKANKTARTRAVIWPGELADALGFSPMTVMRHERAGNLPPRDFFLGGKSGWQAQTLPGIAPRCGQHGPQPAAVPDPTPSLPGVKTP
jgi:hypothetical protein